MKQEKNPCEICGKQSFYFGDFSKSRGKFGHLEQKVDWGEMRVTVYESGQELGYFFIAGYSEKPEKEKIIFIWK